MSEGIKLPDVLKDATEVTSLSSTDRLVAVGSNGNIKRIARGNVVSVIDLKLKEAESTTIDIVDFVNKYVTNNPVGTLLYDGLYSDAKAWKVKVGNTVFSMQKFDCLVLRNISRLPALWANICLAFIPCRDSSGIYVVNLSTNDNANIVNVSVYRAGMEQIQSLHINISNGGIKRFASISYKVLKGGGLRHERSGENFKRNAEGGSDGCARAASAGGTGLRHVYDAGVCGSRRHVAEPSEGRVQIRRVAGIRPPHVRRPGLLSALNRRRWWCNIFLLESPLRRHFHRPALMGAVEESGRRGHDGHLAGKGVAA